MKEQSFTHEDSLKVIESMIEASKERMKDNGFIWIACSYNFERRNLRSGI